MRLQSLLTVRFRFMLSDRIAGFGAHSFRTFRLEREFSDSFLIIFQRRKAHLAIEPDVIIGRGGVFPPKLLALSAVWLQPSPSPLRCSKSKESSIRSQSMPIPSGVCTAPGAKSEPSYRRPSYLDSHGLLDGPESPSTR
jgi:hypothetical protein